jgi:hypothetical protein
MTVGARPPTLGSGDILSLDLYDALEYYILGDYEKRSMTLKDRVLSRDDLYLEGYISLRLIDCIFNKAFYTGTEGSRFESDTRGTGENPEPYPPYGENSLYFDGCEFFEEIYIRKDCTVIFKDCTFNRNIEISERCRFEFINCLFKQPELNVDDFCEGKFLNCSHIGADWIVHLDNNCRVHYEGGTPQGAAKYWAYVDNNSVLVIHGVEANLSGAKYGLLATNESQIQIINLGDFGVTSVQQPAIYADKGSNIEIRKINKIESIEADAVVIIDAVAKISDITDKISSTQGRGLYVNTSDISYGTAECRIKNVTDSISSVQGAAAISIKDSILQLLNVDKINGTQCPALLLDGEVKVYIRSVDTIISEIEDAIYASGNGVLICEHCATITSELKHAINASNGFEFQFNNVDEIIAQLDIAILLNSCKYYDKIGSLRSSTLVEALDLTNCDVQLYSIDEISSTTTYAVNMTSCVYDLKDIPLITGMTGAAVYTSCRGMQHNIASYTCDSGNAVVVSGCSGPTEWTAITSISAADGDALVLSGDLKQFKAYGLGSIDSTQGSAISGSFSGTLVTFENITMIESDQGDALDITMTSGRLVLKTLPTVQSNMGKAFSVDVDNLEMYDVQNITSMEGDAFVLTVNGEGRIADSPVLASSQSGKAGDISFAGNVVVHNMGDFTTQSTTSLTLNISGAAKIIGVGDVTSTDGVGLDLDVSGINVVLKSFGNIASTSQTGASISIFGSSVAMLDFGTIRSTQGKGLELNISGRDVSLRDFGNISSTQGTALDLDISGQDIVLREFSNATSVEGVGLDLDISSQAIDVLLYDFGTITSTENNAFDATTSGKNITFKKFQDITSVDGDGLTLSNYGDCSLYSFQDITSNTGVGMAFTSTNGEIVLQDFGTVSAVENNALTLALSGSEVHMKDWTAVSTETGNAISGNVTCQLTIEQIGTISAYTGQAIAITGGTGVYLVFKYIDSVSTTTGQGGFAFEVESMNGYILLQSVASITADGGPGILAIVGSGRVEVYDCPSMIGSGVTTGVHFENCTVVMDCPSANILVS